MSEALPTTTQAERDRPSCLGIGRTHHVAVVGLGHEQHAAHQVCGGHPLGASALPVAFLALHLGVRVFAVHSERDVIW